MPVRENLTVLVSGALGMIGKACVNALQARGYQVAATDIGEPPQTSACTYARIDLRDRSRMLDLIADLKPDAIIHAGGYSGPMQSADDPAALIDVNLGGLCSLLEGARRTGTPRFIWFSSILAYGTRPHYRALHAHDRLDPDTVYGATKAAGETLLSTYAQRYGLTAYALRPTGVYGPGRTTTCLIQTLLRHGLSGEPLILNPAPELKRQFIHVDDVVAAALAALYAPARQPFLACNVADGLSWTTEDVVEIAQRLLPGLTVRYDPQAAPTGGFKMGPLLTQNTCQHLNWQTRIDLPEGMAQYLGYLQTQERTS